MKATLLSIGTIAALLMAGCSQQAKEDMSQAGASASNAASHTGDAVAADTKAAGQAAQEAGAKTVEATKDAGAAVAKTGEAAVQATKDVAANAEDAAMTPKVKQALLSSSGLETKGIDVDTKGGTITLSGTVPDAKQKTQAETIAKGQAGTKYKVVNSLTVSAATGATSK